MFTHSPGVNFAVGFQDNAVKRDDVRVTSSQKLWQRRKYRFYTSVKHKWAPSPVIGRSLTLRNLRNGGKQMRASKRHRAQPNSSKILWPPVT